jgi:type VI secretion system protein ImpC
MNAAYVMGTKLTDAFAKYGFCVAIRGPDGGKVEGLPAFVFTSDDGDKDLKCPTELGITDRREAELSKLGFHRCATTRTPTSVFFGNRPRKPKVRPPRAPPTPPSRRGCRTSRPPHGSPITSRSWPAI